MSQAPPTHPHTCSLTHVVVDHEYEPLAYIWVAFCLVYFEYIIELFYTQYRSTKLYALYILNMQFYKL